jgi:DNA-binding protein H-NS
VPDSAPAEDGEGPHALSQREKAAVVHRIRTLMEYWSITPEDLENFDGTAPQVAVAAPSVKYRHPRSGQTWDGCGPHPQWLRDALLREGYTVDELRAAAAAEGSSGA